jgi:hypothetical protein
MERKFRVVLNIEYRPINKSTCRRLLNGDTITTEYSSHNRSISVIYDRVSEVHPPQIAESTLSKWILFGIIEEIKENESDETLILSGEKETENMNLTENPYGRKVYFVEALNACRNYDLLVKDKHGNEWSYDTCGGFERIKNGKTIPITEEFILEELFEMQVEIIPKPQKKVKNWVEIKNGRELCKIIVKDKQIRVIRLHDSAIMMHVNTFSPEVIDKLYDYNKHILSYRIEYLED